MSVAELIIILITTATALCVTVVIKEHRATRKELRAIRALLAVQNRTAPPPRHQGKRKREYPPYLRPVGAVVGFVALGATWLVDGLRAHAPQAVGVAGVAMTAVVVTAMVAPTLGQSDGRFLASPIIPPTGRPPIASGPAGTSLTPTVGPGKVRTVASRAAAPTQLVDVIARPFATRFVPPPHVAPHTAASRAPAGVVFTPRHTQPAPAPAPAPLPVPVPTRHPLPAPVQRPLVRVTAVPPPPGKPCVVSVHVNHLLDVCVG